MSKKKFRLKKPSFRDKNFNREYYRLRDTKASQRYCPDNKRTLRSLFEQNGHDADKVDFIEKYK